MEMMERLRITIAAIFLLILTSCGSSPSAQSGPAEPPSVPVGVEAATEETVPIQVRAVVNVEALASVGVKSQISGPLLNVKFTEGANVKKGDLLFEIDSRPFRETLRQAEAAGRQHQAELRVAEANLARSRAQLKNAQAEAARFEQLSKEGISTRMQEDQIRTAAEVAAESARAAEAAIEGIRATLESNQSAVDQAKLFLSYAQIHAPISGRTGNLLLHPGNLVTANSENPLVVINQIAPIFVVFGVPERHLSAIAARNAKQPLVVEASSEESGETSRGILTVIDNTVDPSTGTIRLKGTFDNTANRLWPGQFVNVVLTLDNQNSTLIRAEALQAGQQGSFVYVVKADGTVEARPVEVGQAVGGKVVIESGIMAGEEVVIEGQSRLYPGAKISRAGASPDAK
jgi:multidrug efflux system membrane fusion protein